MIVAFMKLMKMKNMMMSKFEMSVLVVTVYIFLHSIVLRVPAG